LNKYIIYWNYLMIHFLKKVLKKLWLCIKIYIFLWLYFILHIDLYLFLNSYYKIIDLFINIYSLLKNRSIYNFYFRNKMINTPISNCLSIVIYTYSTTSASLTPTAYTVLLSNTKLQYARVFTGYYHNNITVKCILYACIYEF